MPEVFTSTRSTATELPGGIILGGIWAVSADLLCVLDFDGYFLASNPAWMATLGWSAQELQAASFIDFVHPDDSIRTLTAWSSVRKEQPALRFQNRYRTKGGDWLAVLGRRARRQPCLRQRP